MKLISLLHCKLGDNNNSHTYFKSSNNNQEFKSRFCSINLPCATLFLINGNINAKYSIPFILVEYADSNALVSQIEKRWLFSQRYLAFKYDRFKHKINNLVFFNIYHAIAILCLTIYYYRTIKGKFLRILILILAIITYSIFIWEITQTPYPWQNHDEANDTFLY